MPEINLNVTVKAPAKDVYNALTRWQLLTEWFCDDASVAARPGGYFFAAWLRGYQASGKFSALDENKHITLTLRGDDEPADGQVDITLAEANGSTSVTVKHSHSSEQWQRIWQRGLENLQSYLETGYDLRITRRPMIGIAPVELDDDEVERSGVSVKRGIRIASLVANMSAEKSGLLVNDVIVELDGKPVTDYASLVNAVGDHQAGDVVNVQYYRGTEKLPIELTFMPRPVEPIPATAQEAADRLDKLHTELDAQLRKTLEGATEEEMTRRPAPKDWSARETIIHLLALQRWFVSMIGNRIAGEEFGYGAVNDLNYIGSFAACFKSTQDAVDELKRNRDESQALVRAMTDEFVARRGAFGYIMTQLNSVGDHDREHFEQIRKAIEAARVPAPVAGD